MEIQIAMENSFKSERTSGEFVLTIMRLIAMRMGASNELLLQELYYHCDSGLMPTSLEDY